MSETGQITKDRLYQLLESNAIGEIDDETGIGTVNVDALIDDMEQFVAAELTRLQQSNAALVERERILTDALQELLNAPYEPNTLAGGLAHMSAESNAKRALAQSGQRT